MSSFFWETCMHQIEICKGDNVDAELEIHFAMSGVAPPGAARPCCGIS